MTEVACEKTEVAVCGIHIGHFKHHGWYFFHIGVKYV